ncbi:hypothetical protein LCGC14_2388510, partial [marine sediment metagenome]
MTTWDDKTAERFAELTRHARGKANTLGDDGNLISEPFRRIPNVIVGETWLQTPDTSGGLIPPDYDGYNGVQGSVGTRYETSRLYSYPTSGVTGPNSVQTFFVVSANPASHSQDDIELVRRKNLISSVFSEGKSDAAEPDPNIRGFALALYPAKSSPGGGLGNALIADVNKPIQTAADPGAVNGIGDNFWTVDYMNGIVRFSVPPLNGSSGVMNPNGVYSDLEGLEISDAYGEITIFATYYQYSGTFGRQDAANLVTVGDSIISNGTFDGYNNNTIQTALNSISAGGTVFIKEGDYTFAESVTVSVDQRVVGLGRVNIIAPPSASAFDINGDNVEIEGLTIRTTASSTGGSCIELSGGLAGDTLDN